MIPIYQTVVDKNKGNCMQAAMASLFEIPLEKVPNFIEHEHWFHPFYDLIREQGAEYDGCLYNGPEVLKEFKPEQIKDQPGINGFFYASVYSPKYFDPSLDRAALTTHAVIIDKDFNIVHDPNPSNKGLKLYPLHEQMGYNGILHIYLINRVNKSQFPESSLNYGVKQNEDPEQRFFEPQ